MGGEEEGGEIVHEGGGAGAVDDAMVGGKRQGHDRAHCDLAVDGNDAILDGADGKNGSLGLDDDGGELVDVEHAEIADGECGAGNVFGAEAIGAGAVGEVAALNGDFAEAEFRGVADYGGNDAIVDGHGDGDIDFGVQADGGAGPGAVDARVLREGAGDEGDEQVGMRELRAVRFFDVRQELIAGLVESGGVDFAREEKVRDGGPALRGALGHEASDGR